LILKLSSGYQRLMHSGRMYLKMSFGKSKFQSQALQRKM
jgi:hypothetical protein